MSELAKQFYQEINGKYDKYIGGNETEKLIVTKNHAEKENQYNRFTNRVTMGTVESTYLSLTGAYKEGLRLMHDRIIPIMETLHAKDGMDYPVGYQKAMDLYKSLPAELNFPEDAKSKEMLFYFTIAHEMAHAHYPEKHGDPYVNQKLNDIQLSYTTKATFEGMKNEMRADSFAFAMLRDKYQHEPQYHKVIEGIEKIRLAGSLLGMTTGDPYNFVNMYGNDSKFMKELPPVDSRENANEITKRAAKLSLSTLKEYGVFISRENNSQIEINEKMKTKSGREALFKEITSKSINLNKELCDYADNKVQGKKVDEVVDGAMAGVVKTLDTKMSDVIHQIHAECSNTHEMEYGKRNHLDTLLQDLPVQAVGVSKREVAIDLQQSVANFYKDKGIKGPSVEIENNLRP